MGGSLYGALRQADFRLHLFSFYHERKRKFDQDALKPSDFRLFADSGAFSAWTRKEEIDIEEYSTFVRYHIGYLEAYAALDVIPTSTHPEALEQAASMSWENYQNMIEDGLDPIPIYHYGESRKWLDKILESGCKYIGLGGMGNANRRERLAWLDSIFNSLPNDINTHGFGVSVIDLLFRYPWYSADSTTWLMTSSMGKVFIPRHEGGQLLFDCAPYLVHTQELMGIEDAMVDKWLRIVGTDRQQLHTNYVQRYICNAVFMREVTSHRLQHGHKKRSSTQQGLFR